MEVKFKKLSPRAKTPAYAMRGDACFDLSLLIDDDNRPMAFDGSRLTDISTGSSASARRIDPEESIVFHTGLAFEVPEGHVMLIFPRSSTGIKLDLSLSNGTGVIDSGYRGEVRIALRNEGLTSKWVEDGQRVAQAMIVPYPAVEFVEADALSDTERGAGGIGSTGRC